MSKQRANLYHPQEILPINYYFLAGTPGNTIKTNKAVILFNGVYLPFPNGLPGANIKACTTLDTVFGINMQAFLRPGAGEA